MTRADLHLHTTASDGIYPPAKVIKIAAEKGLQVVSLTDHDTLSGLPEALKAAQALGLRLITGVELSAGGDGNTHILGYGMAPDSPVLLERFEKMRGERIQRARAMAERLAHNGMPLPIDEIIENAGDSVGRPHLARAMAAAGYVPDVATAFQRFLAAGRPAYVPRDKLPVTEAIEMLRRCGAVPVLAHPGLIQMPLSALLPLLDEWREAVLKGLEAYYPLHKSAGYQPWLRIARERGLLVTGGSDFHDLEPRHGAIGETAADWLDAQSDVDALTRAIAGRSEAD